MTIETTGNMAPAEEYERTYLAFEPYFTKQNIPVKYMRDFKDDPDLGPLLILILVAASNAGGQHTSGKRLAIPKELVSALKLHEKTVEAYDYVFNDPENLKRFTWFWDNVMKPLTSGYGGGTECPYSIDYFVGLANKIIK